LSIPSGIWDLAHISGSGAKYGPEPISECYSHTAGVQRQYLGCAGKVANGINTAHLAYVREHAGHALIGARQWIPAAQIGDPVRSAAMGLPWGLEFRTKG
jgi:SRSO17 transposase